ncbi:FAD-binding domain-containing protein [Clathrospora elynae]|uniref:FAD-binding domain-containing protein n=1 Tax=Clathrospora elynae TaxID=706981 RepID=A0A6A5SQT0_9PLEO|nr:FAD-binding domain-containing protein [Clathrospora elynae]
MCRLLFVLAAAAAAVPCSRGDSGAGLKGENSACCSALSSDLPSILSPSSPQYTIRTASYWSRSAQLSPACIIQPRTTQDVSVVLATLRTHPACSDTQFAVRSGGHMSWAGANNIDNGVTIDLGYLNGTTLDVKTRVARVQPGARWGGVYAVLDPLGVTVVGGRAAGVGVGGFLVGGGNSFYSAQQGFACDTVVEFELVLGRGEIVKASAQENSDLFQALKGGSSNFGVVTSFAMQAFPAGPLWGGVVSYPKSTTQQHIDAYVSWTAGLNDYPYGSSLVFWTYLPAVGDIVILGVYEDTTGTVAASPAFDKVMAINGTTSTMRVDSHKGLTDELEQPTGYHDIWFTLTFKNDPLIYAHIVFLHEQMVQAWKSESGDPDFITQCMFQSIPTIFAKHSIAKGGNMLGLHRLAENVVMLLLNIAVKTPELEVRASAMLRRYVERIKEFAESRDGLVEWVYLNYADGSQDPLASYGLENVEKIRKVAEKYDPDGVFQKKAPGGFKISKVGTIVVVFTAADCIVVVVVQVELLVVAPVPILLLVRVPSKLVIVAHLILGVVVRIKVLSILVLLVRVKLLVASFLVVPPACIVFADD